MRKKRVVTDDLIQAARRLSEGVGRLKFATPVEYVYNPLSYAWGPHQEYLRRYGMGPKQIVFLGMNPGPFGMAQTGIPFGQVQAVREWLGITGKVSKPAKEHPQRPITGFSCLRSEVSGQRLWNLFARRFGEADNFFANHIVMNYCPLVFMEASGRNLTPDKLSREEKTALFHLCDEHLRTIIKLLEPEWLIGIGAFAASRAVEVFPKAHIKIGRILHPSPANPTANEDWASHVIRELEKRGIWENSR